MAERAGPETYTLTLLLVMLPCLTIFLTMTIGIQHVAKLSKSAVHNHNLLAGSPEKVQLLMSRVYFEVQALSFK